MPEESTTPDLVEAVRTGFGAVNRHDLEALRHVYAPDVVVDVTGLGITLTGWAAVRSFVEDWIGAYDEVEWVPEEPLDLGNGVVFAVVFQNGRPKGVEGLRSAA